MLNRILVLVLFLSFLMPSFAEENFFEASIKFDEETETIYLENPMAFKYDTGIKEVKKMSAKEELSKTKDKTQEAIFKKNNISIESNYKKEKSEFLTDKLSNKQMIKYDNDRIILSAGISNTYEYANLSKAKRKFFFSPQFRINKHIILGLDNAINTGSGLIEQGASIRYVPYFLKNSSLGLRGSLKQREDNTYAKKFELNSEFYLW